MRNQGTVPSKTGKTIRSQMKNFKLLKDYYGTLSCKGKLIFATVALVAVYLILEAIS
jgi:hypothetical protein